MKLFVWDDAADLAQRGLAGCTLLVVAEDLEQARKLLTMRRRQAKRNGDEVEGLASAGKAGEVEPVMVFDVADNTKPRVVCIGGTYI